MTVMKKYFFALSFLLNCTGILIAQSSHSFYFDQPAAFFEETFVLGNGKTGATVFGRTDREVIYLNDATLWSGEPVNANMNPQAHTFIPEIREALRNENYPLAEKLQRKVQGSFSQSFAPLGTAYIRFDHKNISNYHREISLREAIATVNYSADGVKFSRSYYVSYPDKILVIKLSASQKKSLNFSLNFDSQLRHEVSVKQKMLFANGQAPYKIEPNYRGNIKDPVLYDAKRGTRFSTQMKIKNKDGKLSATDSSLVLKNATEAIIYIAVETSFNGFNRNPATEGKDAQKLAATQLKKAFAQKESKIRKRHTDDFGQFYNRVSLSLGKSNAPDLPINERLKRYALGKEDKNLEILYFNFGRYLLISSSRTPAVPANLQGIWNPYIRPPWSSNYTTNINAEENYWPAETANLSEMHKPLLGFIENLSKTGAITARNFYGTRGWVCAHNSDIWAMTNPVGDFGDGDPSWANWNMAGVWLSTHLWEHFLFTGNKDFLKNKAYPLMKGAAQFCLDWLVEDKNGFLITSPSTSPENRYKTPEGFKGATLYGATADLAMMRELFAQNIEAANELGLDKSFSDSLGNALKRFYPYQISKNGHLQEWYHDWEDEDPRHRHQTHLFGLHPGQHITPEKTPNLAAASRKTLEIKGDETTGWSKGWRINLWARLWDGNRAYKMYRELLRYVDPDGYKGADKRSGGGTYPNLFDAHPPFQIDGNFGGTAAVIEMLMQSTRNEIRLLPALPMAWNQGEISGIKARGNFEVAIQWSENRLKTAQIKSLLGNRCNLITNTAIEVEGLNVSSQKNESGFYVTEFNTERGKSYQIKTSENERYYIFSYFKNNSRDGLHLAGSTDGLNWEAFKNDSSFLTPQVANDRLMRDPCIIRGADGLFHMVWTVSWTDKGIGYANSPDLINWSEQKYLPVMAHEVGARNSWAPEITYDPWSQNYMIYWATTITGLFPETQTEHESGLNHRMYYVTTRDFKTFSDTKLLYDPGFNVIDATILHDGQRWVMFLKDETREPVQKNLKIAYANELTGPYSKAGKPITGNFWVEGPTALKRGAEWIVYFDRYRDHRYGAIQSTDLETWTDISDKIKLPRGIRHGSILEVSEKEYLRLKSLKQ